MFDNPSARLPNPAALDVSRETFQRLILFRSILLRWSDRINLIGRHESDALWDRHIKDSLRLRRLIPEAGSIADLGSGAGFPGLVLAVAMQRHITLVESDQRKAAFLREAARMVAAPVTVIAKRVEVSGLVDIDIITARALAPLPRLLHLAAPLVADQGVCLFLKGARVETELTAAQREWQMSIVRHPGPSADEGCVIEVKHLRRLQPTIC